MRRKNSRRQSWRTSSRPTQPIAEAVAKIQAQEARKLLVCQLFQSEFRGLEFKPTDLSRLSEPRSKLTLTRDHAEKLIRELTFVDPHVDAGPETQGECGFLHRVALVPSLMKSRMLRRQEVQFSHAIVQIQRIFRGFQVRARIRREKLLQSIHHRQQDDLYAKLHRNFVLREKRRLAAIAIQRIYKGFATRELMARWRAAAIHVQRVVRGHRGRKRAIAFREGNLAFYMAERVFQRGVSISGRSVLLLIEKCGLSFRLEAYEMSLCSTYSGFVTHDSTMMLIRYENWSAAQGLCGQDVFLHGVHAVIDSVAFIDRVEGQCVMNCRFFEANNQEPSSGLRLVTQMDCLQAINLRNVGTKGRQATILPLPLTASDTPRIVASLVERLALVPAITMATKELKKKTAGGFILTVMPPPKVHYTFHKTDTAKIETATRAPASIPTPLLRLVAFPVVNGYRGISVGKLHFRKKCTRHSVHFTKCRCVLPFVTTPAYVEAITLALAPPSPTPAPQNHTL